jgi:hypothetical protein
LARGAVGVIGVVGEWLVVELEKAVGMAGEGVVPSSGVPGPTDPLAAEPITDGRVCRGGTSLPTGVSAGCGPLAG